MSNLEFSNTYVKINLDAIRENFSVIAEKAGVPVMAVVKADAYGHGAVPVAKLLEPQCAFLAVANAAEALELRRGGIYKPILILGHISTRVFGAVVENDIRPTIFTYEDALALSEEAAKQGKTAQIHIAVDTGMSRIGFQATQQAADICAKIAKLPNLEVEGLFSHFATADEADLEKTCRQAELFDDFCRMLEERGVAVKYRHLDNSAGIMNRNCHYDMVRAGIILYGLYPSNEVDPALLPLKPAMSWHTHISHLKQLEPGRQISYGGTYTTDKPTLVATIPAGYADGYRRSLSGKFYVLIRGKKAPILGRICMDQFLVDVTDIPGVQREDAVVLMGRQEEVSITAEEISAAAQSFNYEQVCDVSRRVPRVYYRDGKRTESVNYLLDK